MPTVGVIRDDLFALLGRSYTQDEFELLCFEFGVELDDVTTEAEQARKMGGGDSSANGALSTDVIYKIDVPANRYDLLCIEGLARAFRIFLGLQTPPEYEVSEPKTGERLLMTVEAETAAVRPFVVCAVLRGVTLDPKRYQSFIELQDKLHQNICRRRTLVAIGTHDLDTLTPPFRYRALPPEAINFVPLTEQTKSFDAKSLLEHYKTDGQSKHLAPYVDIIYDKERYPVIYDAEDRVLSLPPIINGYHSRIQLHTKDIFIECTATDYTKANIVLDTVVTMFSEYCEKPFASEYVDILYEADGRLDATPKMTLRQDEAAVADVNSLIGIDISPRRMCELCDKMQLGPARHVKEGTQEDGGPGRGRGGVIRVTIPPTRHDIMHSVDIIEDIAVAYGYNNVVNTIPKTLTVGAPQPLNHFCDLLRDEISRAGFSETLTHGLCSISENYELLRRSAESPNGNGPEYVSLSNPANIEYEIVRTSLIPGMLKTLHANRGAALSTPLKLFEISDVVLRDLEATNPSVSGGDDLGIVGARNQRRLAALYASMQGSGFEILHGLVTRVMQVVQVPHLLQVQEKAKEVAGGEEEDKKYSLIPSGGQTLAPRPKLAYRITEGADPCFFPGRCAQIFLCRLDDNDGIASEKSLGFFGIVHPEVLHNYGLAKIHAYPTSIVELELESLQYET
eukprot:scaffold564_cov248-Pinguiococcus_pyrenoidosus.AAC.10